MSISSRLCDMSCNMAVFYGEELLASPPAPKLEDHPFSDVSDWLFNMFAAIGGRSSVRIQGRAMPYFLLAEYH